MRNTEQALRLLKEVERLTPEEGAQLPGSAYAVSPSALLEALIENEYDLTAAIVSVASGS